MSLFALSDILKAASDTTRLRIMLILHEDELAVNEIVEILEMNQSAVSNQLSFLKKAGILKNRKEGKRIYYTLVDDIKRGDSAPLFKEIFNRGRKEDYFRLDLAALKDVLEKRREESLNRFSQRKNRTGPCPGESWESFARGFIGLLENQRIADLGCGAGRLAALLAAGGNRVTGYDNDREQLEIALGQSDGYDGLLDFRYWDIEKDDGHVDEEVYDLAILSQTLHHLTNPAKALKIINRMMIPGGRLLIFDLAYHGEEGFKDLYGDFWLGFEPERLTLWLEEAGFEVLDIRRNQTDRDYKDIDSLVVRAKRPL
ncbi:MAG: metalloregulator ArsR/SmtB family transcription factor [Spirochaetales bacterium]|nr:metalloregulator ArsR/SmtB family transcription factor [Spirochaetales bacterium]